MDQNDSFEEIDEVDEIDDEKLDQYEKQPSESSVSYLGERSDVSLEDELSDNSDKLPSSSDKVVLDFKFNDDYDDSKPLFDVDEDQEDFERNVNR